MLFNLPVHPQLLVMCVQGGCCNLGGGLTEVSFLIFVDSFPENSAPVIQFVIQQFESFNVCEG